MHHTKVTLKFTEDDLKVSLGADKSVNLIPPKCLVRGDMRNMLAVSHLEAR